LGNDAERSVVAYELLFQAGTSGGEEVAGEQATSQLIATTFGTFGLDTIAAGRPVFINFTRAFLTGVIPIPVEPENVVVGDDGRVRLLDFGIARALADATPQATPLPPDSSVLADLATLATAGDHAGTPAYMAPEQLTGAAIDGRADQFAFCVALWEALFGERPGGPVAIAASSSSSHRTSARSWAARASAGLVWARLRASAARGSTIFGSASTA
jgi:hypothetical protein